MQYSYCTHSLSTNTGAFLVSNRLVYCYYRHIGPGGSAIKIDSEMVFGDSFGLTEFFPLFPSVNSPGTLAHGCISSFLKCGG